MRKLLSRFKSDISGVATLEFMLLMPALFMWFAGTFVFFDAFHKWMKSLKATYTVSDLITRQTTTSDAFIGAMDGIFDSISQSRDAGDTWLRVSQVRYRDGVLELIWSTNTYSNSDVELVPITIGELEEHIPTLVNDEYVIVTQTYNRYNPLFDWVGIAETTFYNAIAAPLRFSATLTNTDHEVEGIESFVGLDPDDHGEDDAVFEGDESEI